MNIRVIKAVFKRNFLGYFANPTGYVFICVFVLLSAVAAFLPDEFFNANLANLDQLNIWFPLIMLVFIPAITMGSWADERRQGTDELLLTLPAGDFEIVLGKYKAAVAILSASLLFSLCCNLIVLRYLGRPDLGLFFCTYFGYWLIGLAMLAIGMVASFLTGNLTVSYILGALFCAPLVMLQWAEAAPIGRDAALLLKEFSIGARFEPFGRGIITLSGMIYFAMIIVTMLYLCIVLIGRRHWTASQSALGTFHFTARALSLFVIGLSCCFIVSRYDCRADMTAEKLSSLSPNTIRLLRELKPEHPVVIDAFISPDVPQPYVQTRLDVLAVLDEIRSICGRHVSIRLHAIKPHTKESLLAAQRYDIRPRDVLFATRGTRDRKSIFMGVSLRCGLRSLTLPFIDRGLSAEYELVHALSSVIDPAKKRIGILKTDAPLFGQMDFSSFTSLPPWSIIEELRKQYTVVEVDPKDPITERYDALVAVQPSSLGPPEMDNFIAALRGGQPAVIFEDPFPLGGFSGGIPGTADPRRSSNQMMMMMGQMQPKGDITALWELLDVAFDANHVSWQDYNPIRKISQLPKGFVFLDRTRREEGNAFLPFSREDSVSADIQYMMFAFPGLIAQSTSPDSKLTYHPLVRTFREPAGRIAIAALRQARDITQMERQYQPMSRPIDLAVHIRGELPPLPGEPVEEGRTPPKPEPVPLNIVLIADVDMIADGMFEMRSRGNEPGSGINLMFDNVTFVLNAIDSVAGDERYIALRGRRPMHRTLKKIDEKTAQFREDAARKREKLQKDFNDHFDKEQEALSRREEDLRKQLESGRVAENEIAIKLLTEMAAAQKRVNDAKEEQERQLNIALEESEVDLNENIRTIQGWYKFYAVVFPPIPPLVVGLMVLLVRRIRETEGIPKTRRKK